MRSRHLVLAGMALATWVHTAAAQKEKKVRHDPRLITAEEIATRQNEQNALDLIRALRPSWLNTRGPTTIMLAETGISVYVDGAKRGSIDELRFITREQIQEMRSLSATDAQARYGMDNVSGAIEVTTKRN